MERATIGYDANIANDIAAPYLERMQSVGEAGTTVLKYDGYPMLNSAPYTPITDAGLAVSIGRSSLNRRFQV